MATLTQTAYLSRIGIKYGGIVLVGLMVGRVVWNQGLNWWKQINPEPPPPPDVVFGVLPNLTFPQKFQPQLTYTAEFPTGQLPAFGDRTNVYKVVNKESQILALDSAKKTAEAMGFTGEPQERSPELYRWTKTTPYPSTLDIYIYWGIMIMSTDWSMDPNFFTEAKLPTEEQAIDQLKSYLKKANLLPQDLQNGEAAVSYLKASGGAYLETISLSEADFIRVDLSREKIDDLYAGYTPDPKQGVVRGILSGNQKANLVQLEYYYYPIQNDQPGVYPLKNPAVAWQELIGGKGYIAQIDPDITQVVIRRLELGYYESFTPQQFYQPIYVFKGDNNFTAYVEAVAPPTQMPTLTPAPPK